MSNVATCQVPGVGTVKLGRIIPKAVLDYGRFRVVVLPDGTQKVSPRLSYNTLPATATPPDDCDYSAKAMASIARMYKNDQYGDCVVAGKGHQFGIWTGNDSGTVALATDTEIVNQYHQWCGAGDNGCNISDVLDRIKAGGMVLGGKTYHIDGYVSVDNTNKALVMVAHYLFGTLTLGIDLPSAWANAPEGGLWDVTNTGIVGGHDVCSVAYTSAKGVTIATWAGLRTITWPAFTSRKWITELYAELSPSWYGDDRLAPMGIDAAALQADLALIANGQVPPIPDAMVDWFA